MFYCSQPQAGGRIVRGMSCRHLSVHGCNFESDRRRKVGSGSLSAKERYVRIGGRTESNRKLSGGEVVHRLWLGLEMDASAPTREQLRETYTSVRQHLTNYEMLALRRGGAGGVCLLWSRYLRHAPQSEGALRRVRQEDSCKRLRHQKNAQCYPRAGRMLVRDLRYRICED